MRTNSTPTSNSIPQVEQLEFLTDISPSDKPWDVHRAQAQQVEGLYQETVYDRLAVRIRQCSGYLAFGWATDLENGEARLKLVGARFCRVRHCPVCWWRRSLMWQARFLRALPEIESAFPTARWIFLTLTVRNCPITDLRSTIQHMNLSFNRMTKRPEFAGNVIGWIRSTEVTRGHDGSAHPHFHLLMMVRPSYFGKGYVTQARWTELWKESARLDYTPIVHVQAVKSRRGSEHPLRGAIAETLKYSTKPEDLMDRDWLLELTSQVYKLRFIGSGGLLKEVLRESEEETDEDLMLFGEDGEPQVEPEIFFGWHRRIQRYVRI
ncbi:plasmid rolling circle replication initiator protein Rep [Thermostichus sp. MS-CIW-19]